MSGCLSLPGWRWVCKQKDNRVGSVQDRTGSVSCSSAVTNVGSAILATMLTWLPSAFRDSWIRYGRFYNRELPTRTFCSCSPLFPDITSFFTIFHNKGVTVNETCQPQNPYACCQQHITYIHKNLIWNIYF